MTQRTIFDAEQDAATARMELGMLRAKTHARKVDPAWEQAALGAIRRYAETHRAFLAEDVRRTIATPEGVDGRAWGGLMKHAERCGWIKADGFGMANSSNRSPKVNWCSLIYRGDSVLPLESGSSTIVERPS
jgi:hypothetical protein